MIKPRGIILLGKPGSGKGTQGKIMDAIPGFHHISSGKFLRNYSKQENDFGKWIQSYLHRGELLPDDAVMELLQRYLQDQSAQNHYTPGKDYVLWDGIPRSKNQLISLTDISDELHLIYIKCDNDDELLSRINKRAKEQNRPDDTAEVFQERLRIFHRETQPILKQFSKEKRYEVDGLTPPLQVHLNIVKQVMKIIQNKKG